MLLMFCACQTPPPPITAHHLVEWFDDLAGFRVHCHLVPRSSFPMGAVGLHGIGPMDILESVLGPDGSGGSEAGRYTQKERTELTAPTCRTIREYSC